MKQKLLELCDIQYGYAFDSAAFTEDSTYLPLVRIRDVKRGYSETFFSADYPESYVIHTGDLLVGMDGEFNIARWKGGDALLNQRVCKAVFSDNISPLFFYYYFRQEDVFFELAGKATGSASQANISTKTISDTIIKIPDIIEQHKIAYILSTIDEKIALNTAINENLEQQAQALFKAWFVDFEPFGGIMPDDWQDISVYDLADYINGAAFKKAEYGDSGLPIIKIAELKSGITDSTQYCCVRKDDKYYIDDRDILFSWSGNPDTSIDTFLWSRGKAILNQHTFRVVSKYNAPAFTYFLLKYLKPQFAHIASNKQTTGLGHVTVADLKRLQFCSNIATINEFEVLAAPIFNAIFAIYKENQHLAALRDTLLPKLMNGEIDVSEVKI